VNDFRVEERLNNLENFVETRVHAFMQGGFSNDS